MQIYGRGHQEKMVAYGNFDHKYNQLVISDVVPNILLVELKSEVNQMMDFQRVQDFISTTEKHERIKRGPTPVAM